jgi:AsmA-like C-terminal region
MKHLFAKQWLVRLSGWAKAVLGTAIIALLAGLVAPHFFPAERYRDAVAELFAQQTGHRVNFGEMRVRILPGPGFVLDKFRMENPEGFAGGELVAAREARCAVAFWPLLLRGELRLTRLELVRPKVVLLRDATGQGNYAVSPELAEDGGKFQSPSREGSGTSLQSANPLSGGTVQGLDELLLRNADIFWGSVDRQGNVSTVAQVTGVNVDLRHLVFAPLTLRQWEAEGSISGTRITLMGWKMPIVIRRGKVTLHDGELESSFTADWGDAGRMEGTLRVADLEHPVAKFDVKTSELDFDALIASESSGKASSPRREGDPPAAVVPSSTLKPGRDLEAEGHLAAERVRAAGYVAGPATADLRLYSDRLEIWPLTLRFKRGSVQISARTDRRQTPERFSANIQARNIDVDQILRAWPSLHGRVAGTGELDLQIFGSLDAAWLKSLWGKGQFVIHNGRITGFDLAAVALPAVERRGEDGNTIFTAISGDLAISGEHVRSRDIHLYAPRRVADMRGSFGFNGTLSYDGQVGTGDDTLPAAFAGLDGQFLADGGAREDEDVTVPFALRGTLRHPELRPGHGLMSFPRTAESNRPSGWAGSPYPNLFGKQ